MRLYDRHVDAHRRLNAPYTGTGATEQEGQKTTARIDALRTRLAQALPAAQNNLSEIGHRLDRARGLLAQAMLAGKPGVQTADLQKKRLEVDRLEYAYEDELSLVRRLRRAEKELESIENSRAGGRSRDERRRRIRDLEGIVERSSEDIVFSAAAIAGGAAASSSQPSRSEGESKLIPPQGKGSSDIERVWPANVLDKPRSDSTTTSQSQDKDGKPVKSETTAGGLDENLIRALSSTASIAQMRDLLTEPAFTSLLPIERDVELGCLPPPDAAAYEAIAEFAAKIDDQKHKISAEGRAEWETKVAKLFEETERTLFLQYSLFRLCELSVNSPSGFNNVIPVIIHDIVRRTAEMKNLQDAEITKRRVEEEKSRQALETRRAEEEKTKAAAEQAKAAADQAKAKESEKAAAELALKKAEKEKEIEEAKKATEETRAAKAKEVADAEAAMTVQRKQQVYLECLKAEQAKEKEAIDDGKIVGIKERCAKLTQ